MQLEASKTVINLEKSRLSHPTTQYLNTHFHFYYWFGKDILSSSKIDVSESRSVNEAIWKWFGLEHCLNYWDRANRIFGIRDMKEFVLDVSTCNTSRCSDLDVVKNKYLSIYLEKIITKERFQSFTILNSRNIRLIFLSYQVYL